MSNQRLINAGATLANIAFNIAQRKPSELTTREAEALIAGLDQARKDWDAARSEPEATPAPGAPGQEAAVGTTLAKVNSLIAWIKVGDVTGPCPSITIDDWEAIALALAALPPSGAGEKTP